MPVTDQFRSHAIGDLNFSMMSGDTGTLWAAVGSFSAGPLGTVTDVLRSRVAARRFIR